MFKTLPPSLTLRLLRGEQDILTDQQQERIDAVKRTACPRCGSSLHPKIKEEPFVTGDPLPRLLATCECGFVQDAQTKMVIDRGSAAKVQDPLPIIKLNDD